jgi:hypothetical protein
MSRRTALEIVGPKAAALLKGEVVTTDVVETAIGK